MPVNLKRTFSSQCSVIETTDTNIHIMLPHNIKLYQAFYKIQSFVERLFYIHVSQERARSCTLAQISKHPAWNIWTLLLSVFGKDNKSCTSLVDMLNTYQTIRISFYIHTWHCNSTTIQNMASITALAKMSPQQQTQSVNSKNTTKRYENQKKEIYHIRLQILKESKLNFIH